MNADWIERKIAVREEKVQVNSPSYGDMILEMSRLGRAGKWGKAQKKRDSIISIMKNRDEFHAYFTQEGIESVLTRMILPLDPLVESIKPL